MNAIVDTFKRAMVYIRLLRDSDRGVIAELIPSKAEKLDVSSGKTDLDRLTPYWGPFPNQM